MAEESLPAPLQDSVLTTLVFDERYGAIVAAQVQPDHFDEPHREIARRVLEYRRQYGRPPGQEHLDDLVVDLMNERARRPEAVRRLLFGMAAQAEGLNAGYVASRVGTFVREQRIAQAIIQASERYTQGGDGKLEETESILFNALKGPTEGMDAGIFLSDMKRGLAFLEQPAMALPLAIEQLDKIGVGPLPKEMLLYIAPKGTGKTWFAVHCGVQGLMYRQKVVHITIGETSRDRVVQRYYQSLFGIATKPDKFPRTVLRFNDDNRFSGMDVGEETPKLHYRDPQIRKKLRAKMRSWGTRLGSLVVQEYANRNITVAGIVAYLDLLESAHRFTPTLLIIDSPDLMKIAVNEFRLNTRVTYEELHGLAMRRNLALVCTTQGGRQTIGAKRTRSRDVAEDIGKVQTADINLSFSRTEAEKLLGLGRLRVEHARNAPDGMEVLISQTYATGKYVRESAYMEQEQYWKRLKKVAEERGIEAREEEE